MSWNTSFRGFSFPFRQKILDLEIKYLGSNGGVWALL